MLPLTFLPFLAAAPLSLARPSVSKPTPSAPEQALLLVQGSHSPNPLGPDYQHSHHGLYGSAATAETIYKITPQNMNRLAGTGQEGLIYVPLDVHKPERTILWIGKAGVAADKGDDQLIAKGEKYLSTQLNSLRFATAVEGVGQAVFGLEQPFEVLHTGKHSMLVSVSPEILPIIDMLLLPGLVPVAVPQEAYPAAVGVPPERAEFLAKATEKLKFEPKIDAIVSSLSIKRFESDLRYLTGEDKKSPILSRHSFSSTARLAAKHIKDLVESTGASCSLAPFLAGFTPNVICEYPYLGKGPERHVIFSAHYDSRGSFGSTRAPGGDDDGSGTTQLLGIAQSIKEAGITGFKEKVVLAFFAGEEQGLLGSRAYAKELYEVGATVLLHVQADMLAYHDPSETLQLGFPDLIGTPEASYLLGNISQIYSPELVVGLTSACCSDHQSFHSYGFPATQVFERNGDIIDPMYHNSGDVSDREGYDFSQLRSIAKVTFATLLEIAGFVQG